MPKHKPHKGLLKRIRFTKTGLAKHRRSNFKHLRSSKSPKRLRRLRKSAYMSTAQAKRLSRLLGIRIRGREQPLAALRRSPSPAQRREMRAAARAAVKTKA